MISAICGDFAISFALYVSFLAFENDLLVSWPEKNCGQSL